MANEYRLSSIFQSIANSDFPYENPDNVYESGKAVKVVIDAFNVSDEEKYIFDIFLRALEIDPDEVNNYGVATYENDVFRGHCPAFFGIRNTEEYGLKMGLVIGSTNDKFGITDIFVPCEVEREEVKRGKTKTWEYVYTLNGTPVVLNEQKDNKGVGLGKYFLTLQYTDIDEESGYREDYEFSFPFLINQKREFAKNEVYQLFYNGKFEEALREFGTGGGGKIWLSSNKAFIPLFKEKRFPKDGVLLIATNGQYKFTAAGSHPNIASDIHQVNWQIVATSHPELLVQYQNSDKQWELCTLAEATDLQFTNAQVKNEGYTWLIDKVSKAKGKLNPDGSIPPTMSQVDVELVERMLYTEYVLIHIVEPSNIKIENSPVNTVTDIIDRAMIKVKPYPHLMPSMQEVAHTFRKALPATGRAITGAVDRKPVSRPMKAANPSTTPAYTPEQEAVAIASMGGDYPVAPSTIPSRVAANEEDPLAKFV